MTDRRLALLAFALLADCGPPSRPPVVVPAPPTVLQLNVAVLDEAGALVDDAVGLLDADVEPGEAPIRQTQRGWRESFTLTAPPAHAGWDATLRVSSPSYLTQDVRVHLLAGAHEGPNVVLKAAHTWGDEAGRLRRSGVRILTEDGRDWRYRGYSAFTYLQQYCDGEDIDPLVEDAVAAGARVFRVLGMYEPWLGTFRLAVTDPARYDRCLLDFVHEFRDHGLRVQFVVFADAQVVMPDLATQQRWFAHVAALLANEWNVLGELCNECPKNGVDPLAFQRPPPSQVLWSRGSGLSRGDPSAPAWDVADYHEGRTDEYPRLNEARPYMTDSNSAVFGFPVLQSEPMGASEVDQPGKRAGAIGGDPRRAVEDFGQMGMNFGLQGPGGLFHSDAGLTGTVLGPVQRAMATAFFRGLDAAPPDAHTFPYQRGADCGDCPGIGDMPVAQRDLPAPGGTLRTFCRTRGGEAWCDEIRRNGGATLPRAGWRLLDAPGPGLVRLVR